MIKFNINHYVLVKLTDDGLRILKRKHDSWQRDPQCIGGGKFKDPDVDDRGYSRWQLWHLMSTFGSECYNGCKVPFETEILIDSNQS